MLPRLMVLTLLVVTAGQAAEQTSAREWLERMAHAARTHSYVGDFVYEYEDSIEALRIIHRAGPGGERERLYSLTGAAREIVRDDAEVTCIFPDNRSIVVDRREIRTPLSDLPPDVGEMSRVYRFHLRGTGRIADRDAVRVGIDPGDSRRYAYELWIDRETGLLLRSDLLDQRDRPIERAMFTAIEVPADIPDEWLQPTVSGIEYTWYRNDHEGQAREAESSPWRIDGLPDGFRLLQIEERSLPDSDGVVEHRLYSDGIASVSIYIERQQDGQAFQGRSRVGAVHTVGRIVAGHQTVVVGEVPATTVERIARSITHADAEE